MAVAIIAIGLPPLRSSLRPPPKSNSSARHVGEHHDRRAERRGDGLNEDVAVGDVRELVGHHTFELFAREHLHDAFGGRYRGVRGIPAVANAFGDGLGMT